MQHNYLPGIQTLRSIRHFDARNISAFSVLAFMTAINPLLCLSHQFRFLLRLFQFRVGKKFRVHTTPRCTRPGSGAVVTGSPPDPDKGLIGVTRMPKKPMVLALQLIKGATSIGCQ